MKTKEDALNEIEDSLKKSKLMDKNDTLDTFAKGDYWEKFLFFHNQVRGYYYFTKKSIIFIGGALSYTKLVVPYECIREIKKSNIALFIPTGIKLEVFNENKGRIVNYKFSLLKRNNWIKYIQNKIMK